MNTWHSNGDLFRLILYIYTLTSFLYCGVCANVLAAWHRWVCLQETLFISAKCNCGSINDHKPCLIMGMQAIYRNSQVWWCHIYSCHRRDAGGKHAFSSFYLGNNCLDFCISKVLLLSTCSSQVSLLLKDFPALSPLQALSAKGLSLYRVTNR